MSLDLRLTALVHVLCAVQWDIFLSIILITLSKNTYNLNIMMFRQSEQKEYYPRFSIKLGTLKFSWPTRTMEAKYVTYCSTLTTAHILSCILWNFFVYLGQLQPAYALTISYTDNGIWRVSIYEEGATVIKGQKFSGVVFSVAMLPACRYIGITFCFIVSRKYGNAIVLSLFAR